MAEAGWLDNRRVAADNADDEDLRRFVFGLAGANCQWLGSRGGSLPSRKAWRKEAAARASSWRFLRERVSFSPARLRAVSCCSASKELRRSSTRRTSMPARMAR